MNIQSHEDWLASNVMYYYVHMLNKMTKQTLYVMPEGLKAKPKLESWDENEKGKFYLINGQHSVSASKKMVEMNLDESILKHFRQWDCYVMKSKDNKKLWSISAYYNKMNHFVAMKPLWSTSILGARNVWEAMERPRNL